MEEEVAGIVPPMVVDMGVAQEEVEAMVEALVVDDIKSFKGLGT